MLSPSPRVRRLMAFAVVPVSVVAAAAMISQSSYGAFSASTRNAGNNWRTGSVFLTDDDAGAARFTVANMVPGQTETKCIAVTSSASVPGVVKLFAVNAVHSPKNIEDNILISVRMGSGGGFGSCSGFTSSTVVLTRMPLEELFTAHTDYASGTGVWNTLGVTTGETRTYEITWLFDSSNLTQLQLDGLQGANTGVDFQWELQNI